MYFVITHFTKNKGTTDYFCHFLESKNEKYLLLKHPFQNESDLKSSELWEFDGTNKRILKKFKKSSSFIGEMIRNFLITFYISVRFLGKYKKVIAFWWFNFVPILYTRIFRKITYFWWVDYSRKRFWNVFLNFLYQLFETVWCVFANKVISCSKRQNQARMDFHFLNIKKSIILPNGVIWEFFEKDFFQFEDVAFFYLGSLTPQHGVLDFVEYFYINVQIKNHLYIIGGGELESDLQKTISENHLDTVHFLWRKNKNEIRNFLQNIQKKLYGIAPYSDIINDHVFYGDSLKIREYLAYNIPFLVSDIPYIDTDLQKYGIIYDCFEDIDFTVLRDFSFCVPQKNQVLKQYNWKNILNKEF